MSQKTETKIAGTSRKAEEAYLAKTLAVVRDNVQNYGSEVARMQEDIDVMLQHYHDNDTEVLTILNNTVTLHEHMKRALERNEKALKKPYFGRIVFHDKALDKEESLYIGRGGIAKDTTHWMVVDWRAPVANVYYENGLGKCSYPAPDGKRLKIDLQLKRTYEVDGGKLLDYFDSEVIANDELLTKYLAKNKQAVLGEIIATIQKEQNDIIRKSPFYNVIVQGVAGSGKTTVAMHRISYILYNYEERFKPDDFYIVGSNRILLDYITGVLPDLDVYGIRQMTMEQLFVRLLYEDWDAQKYGILEGGRKKKGDVIRGTKEWFSDLERYCQKLEWDVIPRDSIYLNPRRFVEGLRDGKPGVYDETEGKTENPRSLVPLVLQDTIENYIRKNPTISIQSKIDMLNERLLIRLKDEFLYKGVLYTEAEQKAILKAYRGHYGAKRWKKPIYELYRNFLKQQAAKGYEVETPENTFDVYDLAALAYLYKRVKETEVISEAHHVVIDEAQDFGIMAYAVLKYCIKDCTYTIMGDVSQNIHFGYGLNDWEELRELYLSKDRDSFGVLKKSYRNTVEISEFATNILHHGQFSSYPVEPIIRHGAPVMVRETAQKEQLYQTAARVCADWQKKGFDTIAVVCRSRETARKTAEKLGTYIPVRESNLEKAVFDSGIMVLPVEYTKGLEFDAVLILDPDREEYPVDDGHAKLLYVAATRALHALCVLHTGNLTGLIADPIPKRVQKDIVQKEKEKNADRPGEAFGLQKAAAPASVRKRISIVRNESPGAARPEARCAGPSRTENHPPQTGSGNPLPQAKPGIRPPQASPGNCPSQTKPGTPLPQARPGVRLSQASPGIQPPPIKRLDPGRPEKYRPQSKTIQLNRPGDRKPGQPGSVLQHSEVQRPAAVRRENTGCGDMPPTEKLRPMGHAKIDLAVRWVSRQEDGLYLQSRYGVLRLSPVGSGIVRVSFAKGGQPGAEVHPRIAVRRTESNWKYRESARMVELTTEELVLQVDRATGAIRYCDRDNRVLLRERLKECRQAEITAAASRSWVFLDFKKEEKIYGFGTAESSGLQLRGSARYISNGSTGELPFLLSDQGYGILMATDNPVIFCDIPVYGTYLSVEKEAWMDYYFLTGKRQNTILNACAYLCGKL